MARSLVLALLAALGSSGPLGSCYGVEYRVTLMPDGNGKIEILVSQKLDDSELKAPFPLLEFAESMEGFAAITPAKEEIKDGWRHASFTVYFDDINKLHYYVDLAKNKRCNGKDHDKCVHFLLVRGDTGLTLTIEDWVFSNEENRTPKDHWDAVREDSANVIQWNVTMPGKATRIEGFQKMEGRSASYERSSKTITKVEDAVKWPLCGRRVVECGKSEIKNAVEAAFKGEMHKAKTAWPKIREDLEAARRKAEAEKK